MPQLLRRVSTPSLRQGISRRRLSSAPRMKNPSQAYISLRFFLCRIRHGIRCSIHPISLTESRADASPIRKQQEACSTATLDFCPSACPQASDEDVFLCRTPCPSRADVRTALLKHRQGRHRRGRTYPRGYRTPCRPESASRCSRFPL